MSSKPTSKSATKPASKSAPKSASKPASKKPAGSKPVVSKKEATYDGMKHLASLEWDLNTRATEAKIAGKEFTDEQKFAKIFTQKEQEEFKKNGHSAVVLLNPKAGLRTHVDAETGKEETSFMVGVSYVSVNIGLMSFLVAISKMSPSTGGEKFALKEKHTFDGVELLKCSNDKTTPPIFQIKFK